MYPNIRLHTFEIRMVKTDDGLVFYHLSKDCDGNYYFISKYPYVPRATNKNDLESVLLSLKKATELPVLDISIIKSV